MLDRHLLPVADRCSADTQMLRQLGGIAGCLKNFGEDVAALLHSRVIPEITVFVNDRLDKPNGCAKLHLYKLMEIDMARFAPVTIEIMDLEIKDLPGLVLCGEIEIDIDWSNEPYIDGIYLQGVADGKYYKKGDKLFDVISYAMYDDKKLMDMIYDRSRSAAA